MTYRLNVQLRDGSNPAAEIVDAALPQRGQTIVVAIRGRQVPALVIAIWTPSSKTRGDGLIMVEARET